MKPHGADPVFWQNLIPNKYFIATGQTITGRQAKHMEELDRIIEQLIELRQQRDGITEQETALKEELEQIRLAGGFDRSYVGRRGKISRSEPKGAWQYSAGVKEQISALQDGDQGKTRESKTPYSYRLTIHE